MLGLLTILLAQPNKVRADARTDRSGLQRPVSKWLVPELSQWSEGWSNVAGGGRRQVVYTGLLVFGFQVDLGPSLGARGLSVGFTGLWLQGEDLSANAVGDAGVTSNIAGVSTVRLFRAWVEQRMLRDVVRLRAGVLALDDDFLVVDAADLFVHSGFGTAQTLALNVPSPIYPLGGLGLRLALQPTPHWTVRMGVYDGSAGDPTVHRYTSDLGASINTGLTFLTQAGYESTAVGTDLSVGAFFQAGEAPRGGARGLWGGYVMGEQVLTQLGASELTAFAHASAAWPAPRTVAVAYVDVGLVLDGALWRRTGDTLGLAYGSTIFGQSYVNEQRELRRMVTDSEDAFEMTYRATLVAGIALQPVLQWIRNAHYAHRDSLVLGLRLTLLLETP